MNKLLYIILLLLLGGCSRNSRTEKHQNMRNNIINIHEKIYRIEIDDVLIGSNAQLFIMDNYLIIGDHSSHDKLIHLFDKKSFSYITSTAYKGEGPSEITVLGYIAADEIHHKFYVTDHGKLKIFSYDLDSVLADSLYVPQVKMNMNENHFPDEYLYVNDTLCIGRMIESLGENDFKPFVAKWNMLNNEIQLMKYEHPDIEKKRTGFAVSVERGLYVESHLLYDLMTIGTLKGDLKYNIYGPNWETRLNRNRYYFSVEFCKDKIIASYSGEEAFTKDANGSIRSIFPTKFIVFDMNGNYIQTWETGYEITNFIYDKENNRIIMGLEDEDIQFAYLNLDGIL